MMDFKEYCKTEQVETLNEDFATSMGNLVRSVFGKSVAIDTNSYPNQFIMPPSAYVKLMEAIQKDMVTYWESVNGVQSKNKKKTPYFSYQMKDVNGKASKMNSNKFPMWQDVERIVTGTSFYLQSRTMWDKMMTPFGKNSTFSKLGNTMRGGDICILDVVLKTEEHEHDDFWYPTIPGQENKFKDIEKSDNQFILCCTNVGLKYIIALLGFPVPQYIKVESLKQLGFDAATAIITKASTSFSKIVADYMGNAKKKAQENPEGTPNGEKTTSTSGTPNGETKTTTEPTKIVSSGKVAIKKDFYDTKIRPQLNESKIYSASKYIKSLCVINEAYDINQFYDDNSIDITIPPNKQVGKIFTDMGYKVDRKEDGDQIVYNLSKDDKTGFIVFIGGETPHVAADENGKLFFKKAMLDAVWSTNKAADEPPEDPAKTPEGEKTPEDPAKTPEGEKTAEDPAKTPEGETETKKETPVGKLPPAPMKILRSIGETNEQIISKMEKVCDIKIGKVKSTVERADEGEMSIGTLYAYDNKYYVTIPDIKDPLSSADEFALNNLFDIKLKDGVLPKVIDFPEIDWKDPSGTIITKGKIVPSTEAGAPAEKTAEDPAKTPEGDKTAETPEDKTAAEEPKTDEKPDTFTEAIGEVNLDKVNKYKSKYSNSEYSEIGTIPKEAITKFIPKDKVDIEEGINVEDDILPFTPDMGKFTARRIQVKGVGYVIISCMESGILKDYKSKNTPTAKKKIFDANKDSFGVTIITKNDKGDYVIYANEKAKEFLKLNNKVFNIDGGEAPPAEAQAEPTAPAEAEKTAETPADKNISRKEMIDKMAKLYPDSPISDLEKLSDDELKEFLADPLANPEAAQAEPTAPETEAPVAPVKKTPVGRNRKKTTK